MSIKVITEEEIQFVVSTLISIRDALDVYYELTGKQDKQLNRDIDEATDFLLAIKYRPNQPLPEGDSDV